MTSLSFSFLFCKIEVRTPLYGPCQIAVGINELFMLNACYMVRYLANKYAPMLLGKKLLKI